MEIQERIRYNADELIRATELALDELKVFQYEPRYRNLLGDGLLKKIADWDKNIRARKDDPFTLVVCGEFKRGKSSLINALLCEEVVTANVTTETVTLNRICYGPHSNEAILSGGRRMTLSDEEMKKERLEELIRHAPEPVTQLELHRPIDILRSVTIIDTPGLNDSLLDFSSLVEQALQQADAVLYLCSVESPLSQNELLFLRTMILPQKYTDLFMIANFSDVLRKADIARVQEFMDLRIADMIPGQRVILLSALDELCRTGNVERPNLQLAETLASHFDLFRRKLFRLVQEKRDTLIPDRIHRLTCGMEHELKSELDSILSGLELNVQQAKAQVEIQQGRRIQCAKEQEQLQKQICADIQDMRQEAARWVQELMEKMCQEVAQLSDLSAEDLTKYYSIYCVDIIQEAVNRCVEYHTEQIYDCMDHICLEAARSIVNTRDTPDYGFRFVLDNKTWTMGDNVSYVASRFLQLGLLSLVVDGVAGAMRQKETQNRTPRILQSIQEQYPRFYQSAEMVLENTYQGLSDMVSTHLADYFGNRLEEETAQSEQMLRVAKQSETNREEIRIAVDQLKSALERLKVLC